MRKKADCWRIGIALFGSALCLASIGSTSNVPAETNLSTMWLPQHSLDAESEMRRGSGVMPPKVLPNIAATSDDEEWEPIRIRYFIHDLWNSSTYCTKSGDIRQSPISVITEEITCTTEDILTAGKNNTILNYLLPQAVQMHQQRLKVHPVADDSPIVVGSRKVLLSPYCQYFNIPNSHTTDGIANADFIFYVAAGPVRNMYVESVDGFHCNYPADLKRVIVGRLAFNPQQIPDTGNMSGDEITALAEHTGNDLDRIMRLTTRAMLHGLGFTVDVFSHFLMTSVASLREKKNLRVISSSNVMAAARAHYGIGADDTFAGMEMEDNVTTRFESSYWKGRSTRDDLMAPQLTLGRYSAITMAAMEDTGYFKPVYELAESMVWGRGVGATLFTEKCIVDGVSKFPSMFCATANSLVYQCTHEHMSLGTCYTKTYTSDIPSAMQYFTGNAALGGGVSYMDYCPVMIEAANTSCVSGDIDLMPGSFLHESSRCFDASNLVVSSTSLQPTAICAKKVCDKRKKTYEILVSGAKTWITCNQTVDISDTGSAVFQPGGIITCPSYDIICNEDTEADTPSAPSTTPPTYDDSAQGHIRLLGLMWSALITILFVL